MSICTKYSSNVMLLAALVFGLAGCTVAITEREVFQPSEEHRRVGGTDLALDNEQDLPAGVTLTHFRQPVRGGQMAITIAKTNQRRLIVHCGGNASERKSDGVDQLQKLIPFGNALLFDYPGYGDSEGEPEATQLDAAAKHVASIARYYAKKDAVDNGEQDSARITLWGHSMGGFVCARVAQYLGNSADSIVFETSAQNAARVANAWKPWYAGPFVRIRIGEDLASYDNVKALQGFTGRVLVMGAAKDQALPVGLSRGLATALTAAGIDTTYREFPSAQHMNVPQQPGYQRVVRDFLAAGETRTN